MDYKYIEQLLERYWECQTTLEEEAILRNFFRQADIPASLLPYRDLFLAEEKMADAHLSEDFDKRLMERIEGVEAKEETPCRTISITQRLRPLYRAAAVVAIVLTIGMAAQQGFTRSGNEEATPQLSAAETQGDSLQLFTDMPEVSTQTEAVLVPSSSTDTLMIQ
ncbi:MAG: pyruvate ferredoxin oxidoreductase [Bacteroidaceae bacterium]|nr:pyruvate ferredoxin oxidoreductase [Bacteroidaceae bacterium]